MRHLNTDSRCSQGQLARPIPMNQLADYALDQIIALNERHLYRLIREYVD
jgi:hypothetical protein